MAVIRRVNQLSQMREECSDLRAIESAVSADFDIIAQSFITGAGNTYITNGFAVNMASNPIGVAATSLQVVVSNGSLLHTSASQSGTFFLVPTGTPNVTLNSATVSNVSGAFIPGTFNYIGIDYSRSQDPTTDTQRYLWDPTSNQEDQAIAPAAIILNYEFVITSTIWASNILPIAIVETDLGNNVVSITDSRPLIFRLGTGGVSPNPFFTYPFPQGATENPVTSTSNGSDPFFGGDKGITSFKDWANTVMTGFLYAFGGPYWYSFGSTTPPIIGSIPQLREDAVNTILTGTGNITHSATIAGRINWSSPINLKIVGSSLSYQISTNPVGSTITLSDEEVAYLDMSRDMAISPNLIWTNGSPVVTSVGSVAWTSGLYSTNVNGFGDWIKISTDSHAAYYQILAINSSSQVTLTANFAGTSTTASGEPSQYAFGLYTLPGVTGTIRDIQIATRGSVPISASTFWLLSRSDDGGTIPRVYVRWLGLDLQQGDSEEISGPQLQNVLTYIGSPIESATTPLYVSAYNIYEGGGPTVMPEITNITTGAAAAMTSGQYFLINSSSNARMCAVWVYKDGSGTQPNVPFVNTYIQWPITTGQTAPQTATALATALDNVLPFNDFSALAVSNVVTVTNNSSGVCTVASNVSVGGLTILATQTGTGPGNFAVNDADDLTLAIKKLDEVIGSIETLLDSPNYDEAIEIVVAGSTLNYVFYVTSANATAGATYTNNTFTFTVTSTISAGAVLLATSTGTPTTSGTLTKTGGIGDATITFSSYISDTLVGPLGATTITIPANSRNGNSRQLYTVGKGTLLVFLNGQFLDLDSGAYTEVGTTGAASNQILTTFGLVVGDELEFRVNAAAAASGGTIGPPGPAGPTGPTGPQGVNAFGNVVTVSTKTGPYTLAATDFVILGDATSAPFTLSLPTAATGVGRIFFIKKIDSSANIVTVQANGVELIDSSNTFLLTAQYMSITVVSNGTQYWII